MKRPLLLPPAGARKRARTHICCSGDEFSSLVSASDVPSEYALIPLRRSTDSSSQQRKTNDFREVDEILVRCKRRIVIEAPTGSGKSRKCPNVIISYMIRMGYHRPLLVLTSATIDVVDMQKACRYPSMWKLGGRKRSIRTPDCECVYASIGLAIRWYASEGTKCFDQWGGVFFDELHEAESDLEYSLLWEAAYRHSQAYGNEGFLLFGATATLSAELRVRLQEYAVTFIACGHKPYNVDMFKLQVPRIKDIYDTMGSTCVRLLARGHTVLMFLPGKAEISAMQATLIEANVKPCNIDILPSELSAATIDSVKT